MTENRFAHGASAGAGDDDAPLFSSPIPSHAEDSAPGAGPPGDEADEHAFASEAEEDAYWAGVVDGIRNAGGTPPPRLLARARRDGLLVQMHGDDDAPAAPEAGNSDDILDFTPTQLRARSDGWSPRCQREFVEALADTGVVRAAAARVGMTETSVNRLRRRADARAFDSACTAALRIGGRRIVSIAHERAIEGTVKRHHYRGELKAEERVYDNRLLIALLGKVAPLDAPDPAADAVAQAWEPWMDAIEQGRDAPAEP